MAEDALKTTVEAMDNQLVGQYVGEGSTLCAVTIIGATIYSTNVGDSRAVLARKGGIALDLTPNHTPYDPIERARIEKEGFPF